MSPIFTVFRHCNPLGFMRALSLTWSLYWHGTNDIASIVIVRLIFHIKCGACLLVCIFASGHVCFCLIKAQTYWLILSVSTGLRVRLWVTHWVQVQFLNEEETLSLGWSVTFVNKGKDDVYGTDNILFVALDLIVRCSICTLLALYQVHGIPLFWDQISNALCDVKNKASKRLFIVKQTLY